MDNRSAVLLLGLPNAAFCGIDLLSFTTSPRFQGIKQIPRGWHFVFTGVNDAVSLRHGIWFKAEGAPSNGLELQAFQWKAETEELIVVEDEATKRSLRANLQNIWAEGLTPYRQTIPKDKPKGDGATDQFDEEGANAWDRLTDCISQPLLERVLGHTDGRHPWSLSSASSMSQDADTIPGLKDAEAANTEENELQFLPINLKQTWREGAVGRERTEAAQDRSWALLDLMKNHCMDSKEVIGELQLAFLVILTLNNNSCLEQWKRILRLLLTCNSVAVEHSSFFVHFLETLKLQIEHCSEAEGGLFDLTDEGASLLRSLLKRFRQGLEQQSGSQGKIEIIDELDELEEYLKTEHGWLTSESHVKRGNMQLEDGDVVVLDMNGFDEEDEEGDFAPTIVDLTPELAEQLGLPKRSLRTEQNLTARREREQEDEERDHDAIGLVEDEQDLDEMDARY